MELGKTLYQLYREAPLILKKPVHTFYIHLMKLFLPSIIYVMTKSKLVNKKINKTHDLHKAIDFVYSSQYATHTIKIAQVKGEISNLLELLKPLKPKRILEIGTAGGGTLFLFTRIADSKATIISVDLPGGSFGGGYADWRIPLYKFFAKNNQNIRLLKLDSHDLKTLELVKKSFSNKQIDFLFIDGDHSYEGIKKDFEMYSKLVKEGGVIAFHDIAEHPINSGCQVNKFWNEIKKNYRSQEIIEDEYQGWGGIGILHL